MLSYKVYFSHQPHRQDYFLQPLACVKACGGMDRCITDPVTSSRCAAVDVSPHGLWLGTGMSLIECVGRDNLGFSAVGKEVVIPLPPWMGGLPGVAKQL